PNHKSAYILYENQGHTSLVTIHNKPGGFVSAVGVDYTTHLHFTLLRFDDFPLVRDYSYCPSVYATETTDDSFTVKSFVFLKLRFVYQSPDDFKHVVGLNPVYRHKSVDFPFFKR